MLLARAGLSVLVVDPARPGSDTLSTHALMRGAVQQLHRWGLLERVLRAGTPSVRATSFLYVDQDVEEVRVPIEPRGGIDALIAPRRTVLDPILQEGAARAGAHLVMGVAVRELLWRGGRVVGAVVADHVGGTKSVEAGLVVGADGVRSRLAREVRAPVVSSGRSWTATVYAHVEAAEVDAYLWIYRPGLSLGVIPTNDDKVCLFASLPPARFQAARRDGSEALFRALLAEAGAALPDRFVRPPPDLRVRAFAGVPGFLRRAHGPGWALVGDAGYFRDPITAHGITDALRDAELLARAVVGGHPDAVSDYDRSREGLVREFFGLTDRIASFDWTREEVKDLHVRLSRAMKRQARALDFTEPGKSIPGPDLPGSYADEPGSGGATPPPLRALR
jgi:2-polyprenyl-6-methoxyphenol hydroxylase-like FAD-dependent oxidoreductase